MSLARLLAGIALTAVVLIVAVSALSGGSEVGPADPGASLEDPPEQASEPELEAGDDDARDPMAEAACTRFVDIYADARDGVLTEAEVRAKLEQVEADARRSESPGVPEGARDLLRAATDGGDFQGPTDRFLTACEFAGVFDEGG